MRISEIFSGRYLTAADIGEKTYRLQAGGCELEDLDGEQKPVLQLLNAQKSMVLNKSNSSIFASAWGDDTENWYGGWFVLGTIPRMVEGRACRGLHVCSCEPLPGAPAPQQPTTQEQSGMADFNQAAAAATPEQPSDIPF